MPREMSMRVTFPQLVIASFIVLICLNVLPLQQTGIGGSLAQRMTL